MDFCLLPKNINKNSGKIVIEILSGKYGSGMLHAYQKLLDHAKKSAKDGFKTALKRAIQKNSKSNW